MKTATAAKPITLPTANRLDHACKKFWRSRYLLLMLLPALIWYIVFMYAPMYGAQIAFRDFSPVLGITGSKWVGFKYFTQFFKSEYFGRLIKNTLGISLYSIIVGFPIPIILALLINEVRGKFFKRSVQTVVYLPHFISAVVVVSILSALLSPSSGLINQLITAFGGTPIHFMAEPKYFKTIYVLSDIWQSAGYGSIVYMAALTGIDPSLYEAATVDGASKWDKLIHITLPGLLPTIIIMLILRMGSIFSVGYEKIMPRKDICLADWGSSESVTSNKFKYYENDILFGKIRPYFHKVGFALNNGIASTDAIIMTAHKELWGLLLSVVSSDAFVDCTYQNCKEGSKMPRADWNQMKVYPILIAESKIQRHFEAKISSMTQRIKTLAMQNHLLQEARDRLLPKLMSGELEV